MKIEVPRHKDGHVLVDVDGRRMNLRDRDLDLGCLDMRELGLSGLNAGGEGKGTGDECGDESFHMGRRK